MAPMDLHACVRTTVADVALAHPDRMIDVVGTGDDRGSWDFDRVAQVVTNLLSNALQYGVPGSRIQVTTRVEHDAVALDVHNDGPPLRGRIPDFYAFGDAKIIFSKALGAAPV